MRAFVGAFVKPPNFEQDYEAIKRDFKSSIIGKWTEFENLHFTFKFLGEVERELVEEIKKEIEDLTVERSSTIIFKGLGVFPNAKKPRVLFIKLENPDGAILEIFRKMEKRFETLGFPPEKRAFKPHLTLARIKASENRFAEILKARRNLEFGEINSFKPSLVKSVLTPRGPKYSVLI